MRSSIVPSLTLALFSFVGCAAPVEDEAPSEVSGQEFKLTLEECSTQQDACFRKNPLFGLFTCPAQYTQCTATASNGLPAEVASAVTDAAACTSAAARCTAAARGPAALLACTTTQAECVAEIVGVDLPDVVEGTAACVEETVSCIDDATSRRDLAGCADGLAGCAVEQIEEALPDDVVVVIRDVSACQRKLEACIGGAETAAALTKCSEDGASCVASGLGVTLPDVPVSEVVNCAEEATSCALDASSIREVDACRTELASCASEVIGSVDVPEELSCEQKWNACLVKNTFNFLLCGAELASCRD